MAVIRSKFISSLVFIIILSQVNGQVSSEMSDEEKITFYFHASTGNVSERIELRLNDLSTFRVIPTELPLKLIIHGIWADCSTEDFSIPVISGYLEAMRSGREKCNIICVDYGPLVRRSMTIRSSFLRTIIHASKVAGKATGKLLILLKELKVVQFYKSVHIVSHSLGSHTAGSAAFNLRRENNNSDVIGRITGLDPGNVLLGTGVDLDYQLDYGDAEFVDILHTNAGDIGLAGKYGHIDFYPDGGSLQSKCAEGLNVLNVPRKTYCSHNIASEYWRTSIISKDPIIACKADSWLEFRSHREKQICLDPQEFGEYRNYTWKAGRYYWDTSSQQ